MSVSIDSQRDMGGMEIDSKEATLTFPKVITLDVAGRYFKVSTDILISESGLFRHQLSDRFAWTPQPDGSYFLDADPEIFEHLLRFMRRPANFPVFWSKDRGYDYDLYRRLSNEAEYFQVDALHQWIKEAKYLKAITIRSHLEITKEADEFTRRSDGDVSISRYFVKKTRQVYACPRGISSHHGDPGRCGRLCHNAQGDANDRYEQKEWVEMIEVTEQVIYNSMSVHPDH